MAFYSIRASPLDEFEAQIPLRLDADHTYGAKIRQALFCPSAYKSLDWSFLEHFLPFSLKALCEDW
eukprot:CAMPEP_0170550284 /NCGR_PEP_ID=MMETSP0211-20121228/8355_1 /TAXON_ID=311385 /ORGANISM="Pseudokeronopsis sp., Strain OXSARD2" /LENGTH=65 /DNA_ID=CAMNT_0010856751 /DNA_START=250 /DNA_END=444 /DNA_ORIENTATION=+